MNWALVSLAVFGRTNVILTHLKQDQETEIQFTSKECPIFVFGHIDTYEVVDDRILENFQNDSSLITTKIGLIFRSGGTRASGWVPLSWATKMNNKEQE